jgi:hypothetical protein
MNKKDLEKILEEHKKWKEGEGGQRAYLQGTDLRDAALRGAYLQDAYLQGADLQGAALQGADLRDAYLRGADLQDAYLRGAYLQRAYLQGADLRGADLQGADLQGADLRRAYLQGADLRGADLRGAKGLVKPMGVEPGNYYWKRFDYYEKDGRIILCNNDYNFKIGLNKLRKGETFADDDRVLCSYPGFHFGSRSWCATYYGSRRYEAKIQIPKNAKINEPWATDGKASADMIKIIQVFDTSTGKDVTEELK